MAYSVTITSTSGNKSSYPCGGATDEQALVYAGKVVEQNANRDDPDASVSLEKDGEKVGPAATVRDMTTKTV